MKDQSTVRSLQHPTRTLLVVGAVAAALALGGCLFPENVRLPDCEAGQCSTPEEDAGEDTGGGGEDTGVDVPVDTTKKPVEDSGSAE